MTADSSETPRANGALLRDLLALAAENRRLRDVPTLRRGESEADALADALQEARAGEAERLRAQKLASMAELAASAGHEINNPLAVISGQAQFLLNKLRVPKPRARTPRASPVTGSIRPRWPKVFFPTRRKRN